METVPDGGERGPDRRPEIPDEVYRALSDRDRRYALYYLLEHDDETIAVSELADVVAGWTRASEYGTVSRRERDLVHASLVHRHLPAMAEAGLVRVDDSGESVTFAVESDQVRELVRIASTVELATDANH